jgi:hypothetical protein
LKNGKQQTWKKKNATRKLLEFTTFEIKMLCPFFKALLKLPDKIKEVDDLPIFTTPTSISATLLFIFKITKIDTHKQN